MTEKPQQLDLFVINAVVDHLKRELNDRLDEGVSCPICGQYAKRYRRRIHGEMARFLIRLVRLCQNEDKYYHVREINNQGSTKASTDGSYLVHWGLLESPSRESGRPKAGYYKPTALGVAFVMQRVRVPKYLYIFDNKVHSKSAEAVDIIEALGAEFDYDELMAE